MTQHAYAQTRRRIRTCGISESFGGGCTAVEFAAGGEDALSPASTCETATLPTRPHPVGNGNAKCKRKGGIKNFGDVVDPFLSYFILRNLQTRAGRDCSVGIACEKLYQGKKVNAAPNHVNSVFTWSGAASTLSRAPQCCQGRHLPLWCGASSRPPWCWHEGREKGEGEREQWRGEGKGRRGKREGRREKGTWGSVHLSRGPQCCQVGELRLGSGADECRLEVGSQGGRSS